MKKKLILDLLLYIIAYYYVLLASINDGFSGFFVGVPYAVFLLWDITRLHRHSIMRNLHIVVLIFATVLIVSDKGRLEIIYPLVGKTYEIIHDVNYSCGDYYINYLNILSKHEVTEGKKIFQLKKGDTFHIERQIKTGNADFGIDYVYELQAEDFTTLNEYIVKNFKDIKTRIIKKHYGNIYVNDSKLYYENSHKYYLNGYGLQQLLKLQNRVYKANRFENSFGSVQDSVSASDNS